MKYVASIHFPGCLPESDPVEFDTAEEAWDYLSDERRRYEEESDPDQELSEDWSPTVDALTGMGDEEGTVQGYQWFPGVTVDTLPLCYTVERLA